MPVSSPVGKGALLSVSTAFLFEMTFFCFFLDKMTSTFSVYGSIGNKVNGTGGVVLPFGLIYFGGYYNKTL
jgi:hypothetical protein